MGHGVAWMDCRGDIKKHRDYEEYQIMEHLGA